MKKDVVQFLKILETKKNLLLFFPFYFYFDNQYEFFAGIMQIQEVLNGDFQYAVEYRRHIAKNFDTHMSFLYNKYIVFMEDKGGVLIYADRVELCKSSIYTLLANYANFLYV